jgi:hypothetical protein
MLSDSENKNFIISFLGNRCGGMEFRLKRSLHVRFQASGFSLLEAILIIFIFFGGNF